MLVGETQLKASIINFLIFGFSRKNVFFCEKESKKKYKIQDNSENKDAFYCLKCKTTLIVGEPYIDISIR
jgi:hypothetical protein